MTGSLQVSGRRTFSEHLLDGIARDEIPTARLHRIRVYEMQDLFADYYGEP